MNTFRLGTWVSHSLLRTSNSFFTINHYVASLTETEISAIDEAGAKGPPSDTELAVLLAEASWLSMRYTLALVALVFLIWFYFW